MAEYRIRATGAVMLEGELRQWAKENNGPSWDQTTDEVLSALDVDLVFEGPQAQPTRYQIGYRDGVEQQSDGKWYTKYSVADLDASGIAAKDAEQSANIRAVRKQKLAECDWTQGKDIPDNVSTVWAVYRQELRDVPTQVGFPWDIQWPTQPE